MTSHSTAEKCSTMPAQSGASPMQFPARQKSAMAGLNTAAMQATVDPKAEWAEILHEAWRIERDFYWDPNMEGLDWPRIEKRYAALLPFVQASQ